MTVYYFSPYFDKKPQEIRIAKYVDPDGDFPDEVYTIYRSSQGETCTCPSYKVPCKHILWVREWLALEHPWEWAYDDKKGWIPNPFWADMKELFSGQGVQDTDT